MLSRRSDGLSFVRVLLFACCVGLGRLSLGSSFSVQPSRLHHGSHHRQIHNTVATSFRRKSQLCNLLASLVGDGSYDDESNNEEHMIEDVTRQWIKDIVIKLRLCPYASDVFFGEQIRYAVYPEIRNEDDLVTAFFQEGRILLDSNKADIATTMLVMPNYEGGIEQFYAMYEFLVDVLESPEETLLEDQVQPAFFHPSWSFSGAPDKSPIHFEKRAPFPVINLLRREDLNAVVEKGLEKGVVVNKQIAEHNAHALEQQGYERMLASFEKLAQSFRA